MYRQKHAFDNADLQKNRLVAESLKLSYAG
jgi:hypothetical protein